MRHLLLKALLFAACAFGPLYGAENWENHRVLQVNTEEPHATMTAFNNLQAASTFKRKNSRNYKLLNGNWKFNWVIKPSERPQNFYKTDFDDSKWKTIKVPSNWEIEGYDTAIYNNATYPFPRNAPKIPHSHNPVGSYRTTFTVTENWQGKKTIIHFDGVISAFYLWVNGKKVGYS